jgi:hypothetical protein
MDINPRHNLSTLLAVRCGMNFPWLHYWHLVSGELPSADRFRQGVYWIDLSRDVIYSARYRRTERYSPAEYLRPYICPHVFAILNPKDPAPFIKRCAMLMSETLGRLIRRLPGPRRWPRLSRLGGRVSAGKA